MFRTFAFATLIVASSFALGGVLAHHDVDTGLEVVEPALAFCDESEGCSPCHEIDPTRPKATLMSLGRQC